jgi:hypothetical protein
MTLVFVSIRLGQFTYFSLQVGDTMWQGKNVLDFGGNIGNILRDPNSTIDEERYWCLDVDKDSVEQGRAAYPKSHWLFYDRFSFFFNPYGDPNLPLPDLGQSFDYILAFSVFTNTTVADMLQLVDQLKGKLTDTGALIFTFIDQYHFSWPGRYEGNNFQWRLDLERERGNISDTEWQDLARRTQKADWFTLVNGNDLYIENEDIRTYEPEQQKTYHVFHTERYMRSLFPDAVILPPVNNEQQHCCVIRKS